MHCLLNFEILCFSFYWNSTKVPSKNSAYKGILIFKSVLSQGLYRFHFFEWYSKFLLGTLLKVTNYPTQYYWNWCLYGSNLVRRSSWWCYKFWSSTGLILTLVDRVVFNRNFKRLNNQFKVDILQLVPHNANIEFEKASSALV